MKKGLITSLILTSLLVSCSPVTSSSDFSSSENNSSFEESSEQPSSFNGGDLEVDKSLIYGMTDLSYQEIGEQGTNYKYTHELFKNLGVKSVRIWMHCNWIMNSPTEYSSSGLKKMKAIYDDIKDEGYQIIAMNHSNFHPSGMVNSSATTAKPGRDLTEGSLYMNWLNDLETTYYNMVLAFPDITYWEIDNECNNDDFMPRLGGGAFSLEEKAEIYYDMMYFASRGIHRANPNAITVMGGLVVWNAETFLTYLYDLIYSSSSWSQNPDDYFQVACWHPYMDFFSKKKFIDLNNDIYSIIRNREGKDKKVFLTEVGFSENKGFTIEDQCSYLKDMYDAARDDLYYVESMHYFRMYDNYSSTWGSDAEKTFGLFYDPKVKKNKDGEIISDLAEPKDTAYVYQQFAGGSGPLDTYQQFLLGNFKTELVMHRGYSKKARENTVEAFTLAALEDDVYGIETDVYLSKDNKTVLIHDETTDRVTLNRYKINVKETNFDDIRKIKLPDMQGNPDVHYIPTLKEYTDILNQYNKVGFLELKENFSKEELTLIMDELKGEIDLTKMVIISFQKEALINLREMYPTIEIMLLVNKYSDTSIEELKAYNFGLDVEKNGISYDQIEEVMANDIKVNVWTVDDKELAREYGKRDLTYLTTNSVTSFKD